MKANYPAILTGLAIVMLSMVSCAAEAQEKKASGTKIVLLGTGTPNANPDRSGPSLAIVVKGQAYVVDCGPGVVRRAAAAAKMGITALDAAGLNRLFITHLHSDHTVGLADFIFTPAVLERKGTLEIYGPAGTKKMTGHIVQAYKEDMDLRINGLEMGNAKSYAVNVHEMKEGLIYSDSNIVVKAFRVNHGSWKEAYGFRFETRDKIIVVSGDCTYSENLVKNAEGCDILVHEVYSMEGLSGREKKWKDYHTVFHTSTEQLAAIANKLKPRKLVLTHQLLWSSNKEDLLKEISKSYSGKIVYGNDLDIIE